MHNLYSLLHTANKRDSVTSFLTSRFSHNSYPHPLFICWIIFTYGFIIVNILAYSINFSSNLVIRHTFLEMLFLLYINTILNREIKGQFKVARNQIRTTTIHPSYWIEYFQCPTLAVNRLNGLVKKCIVGHT